MIEDLKNSCNLFLEDSASKKIQLEAMSYSLVEQIRQIREKIEYFSLKSEKKINESTGNDEECYRLAMFRQKCDSLYNDMVYAENVISKEVKSISDKISNIEL